MLEDKWANNVRLHVSSFKNNLRRIQRLHLLSVPAHYDQLNPSVLEKLSRMKF